MNAVAVQTRKLHIGGAVRHPDWEVLDALPGPHVDHLGDARDLSRFETGAFEAVYASHVLEHMDYARELGATLREWLRVLQPGGLLYVSVPDLDVLCSLLIRRDTLSFQERFHVMRMIFGGHTTPYDYHHAGLNAEFLAHYLLEAGFERITRVPEFGLFGDTSSMMFKNVRISLNVVAAKPGAPR